jgi:hypothetical protein
MKEVHVDDLIPGVRYRIHNDSGNDKVGTFINHNSFGPIFTELIALYPVIRQPKPGAVSARTHTFYKSGDTLQREELLRKTLHVVPGLSKYYTGRGRTKRYRR